MYYKVLITSADCPSPGWYVWRRYNQFNELRETVGKYIQLYAPFPQKCSTFNALMGVKPNAQEVSSLVCADQLRSTFYVSNVTYKRLL